MTKAQENLCAIIKERHLLLKKVAIELNVKSGAVSNWLHRDSDIPFTRLSRICEILEIEVVDVITYPIHYVPEQDMEPSCEECIKKQETIDNLNELLRSYKAKLKEKQK